MPLVAAVRSKAQSLLEIDGAKLEHAEQLKDNILAQHCNALLVVIRNAEQARPATDH